MLASAGQGFGVRVWDHETGKQRAFLLCLSEVFSLAFAPDGKTLVAGGLDGLIHRWEVGTWKPLAPLQGHRGRVAGLAFTPNGAQLLSMSWDKTCRLWNWPDGRLAHEFYAPFDTFSGIGLSPDGWEFIWVGNEASIRVWDLTSKKEQVLSSETRGLAACYSPAGEWFAVSQSSGLIVLHDAHTKKVLRKTRSHSGGVRAMAFSPDGKVLASAGLDNTVRIWDAMTFLEMATFEGPLDELRALVWAPDGETLAAAGHDGKIWLWRRK